ncbi:hypothetical protein CKY02_22430 [Photorhabdus bodei]|uniref:Uncharacterized protein n=1 Tax=Photorhabdus bodei TaxID=2029681 RepID=A0A329WPY0_9GAMM|nr:hypothetical protein CKY02_22430 [Photorhabdus bodei]
MASTGTSNGAQPVQQGWGGGRKLAEAAGRPAFRGGGPTVARQLKKNTGFCRGLAQRLTAEGVSLVRHSPQCRPAGAQDIMPIIRIKPLINAQAVARAYRRSAYNSPRIMFNRRWAAWTGSTGMPGLAPPDDYLPPRAPMLTGSPATVCPHTEPAQLNGGVRTVSGY